MHLATGSHQPSALLRCIQRQNYAKKNLEHHMPFLQGYVLAGIKLSWGGIQLVKNNLYYRKAPSDRLS